MDQWDIPMEMSFNNMSLNCEDNMLSALMRSVPPYVPGCPSLFGMTGGMGNICSFPSINCRENLSVPIPVQKETIKLTKSVLYAPHPNVPVYFHARPPGCKTVFVGCLPKKITEEIVREAFEQYGEIVAIRMSEKQFCHIRFRLEEHVEKALYLSGFRMIIENKDESSYMGKLFVDYAIANDDERDYVCAWRINQRFDRHKETSLPAIPLFSEVELQNLINQFRSGNFKGIPILTSWLEKEEVSKGNVGTIFSMLNAHFLKHNVLRLLKDKSKYDDELNKTELMLQQKKISVQFNDLTKAFATEKYSMCDPFIKTPKKNIELWKKQTSELKKPNSEEFIDERVEAEIDMSDGDDTESDEDPPKGNNERDQELCDKIDVLCDQLATKLLQVDNDRTNKNETLKSLFKTLKISKKFPGIDGNFKKFNRISKRSR